MGRGLSFDRVASVGPMKGLLLAATGHKVRNREVRAVQFLNFVLFAHFRGNNRMI